MSRLKEYLIVRNILENEGILRDQLKGIWDSFRSSILSSNFDHITLHEAIFTFLEDHSDFVQMMFNLAELPEIQSLHNLINNKSNSVNRGRSEII